MILRLLAAVGAGGVLALALAAPAAAHGADVPDGTNYRTAVTGVTPAPAGLTVRTVEAGARLELTNRTGRTIEVLGYSGEPYLELRPDGVFENVHSPAAYLNQTLAGDARLPVEADPTAPPQWRRSANESVVRWHDHRTYWMGSTIPPQVRADPSHSHRVRDWAVPLRDGVTALEIRGTLDWLPPPAPGLWWAGCVIGAAAIATLGLVPAARRVRTPLADVLAGAEPTPDPAPQRAPDPPPPDAHPWTQPALAAICALGGVVALAYAVGRAVDAGYAGFGIIAGLLVAQIWPLTTGLGALAAAGYALTRRPAADFALALAGACLAVFAGLVNAVVFGRAIAPVPWDATVARVAVLLVIALGAGVAAAGALRLRAARTAAAPPAAPAPSSP